jgi:tetratricopeptide (TPR) repeat protein
MKKSPLYVACLVLGGLLLLPAGAFALSEPEVLASYAMGFYYLYNDDLEMAAQQFEIAIRHEPDPPSTLLATAAELYHLMGEEQRAEEYAGKALEKDPDQHTALQVMVMVYVSSGRYAEAVPFLESLRRQKPGDLQVLYYLAEAYNQLQEERKLIDTYKAILRQAPDRVSVRLELAYLYTRQGKLAGAQAEYERVLETDPDNERAFFYLAYIHLSRGDTQRALEFFRRLDSADLLNDDMLEDYAVSLFVEGQDPGPVFRRIQDPGNLSLTARGVLRFLEGDLDQAAGLFRQAAEEDTYAIAPYVGLSRIARRHGDPDQESRWRLKLAESYYATGRFEQALDEALAVRRLSPGLPESISLLGDIYAALGRARDAVREYERLLQGGAADGDLHFKLGLQYDSLGRYRDAVEQFNLALRFFPENHELHYYIGLEYRIMEEHRQAARAFEKALELDPDNPRYLFQLGVSYERMGEVTTAIRYLDRSVSIDDSSASALNYLGYLLADLGIRLEEAHGYIEKALDVEPENGAFLDSMGWVYYKMERYQEAREYLEEAVSRMDPSQQENYVIFDHLGDVYLKLDMPDSAVEAWRKALLMKQEPGIEEKIRGVEQGAGGASP